MKSGLRIIALKISLASLMLTGTALTGGSRPSPFAHPHFITVLQEDDHVSVRVGDMLRILMEEAPYEDGRHWIVLSSSPGLKLLGRSETAQGDHGYSSLFFDIVYLYKVLPGASGTLTLRFASIAPDPTQPNSQTFIRQLTVKVVP